MKYPAARRHVLGPSVASLGVYSRALAPNVEVGKTYREALHTDYNGHPQPQTVTSFRRRFVYFKSSIVIIHVDCTKNFEAASG